ncbi:hypothetical protein RND81_14G078600 [Saponaria officinalis]|uniref:Uncharacterized protein n=1 Tax=Saponaria officinalis TaxID=3572 RepID=A0AAW1GJ16_SAPOF
MEGLIPMVYKAIKRNNIRRQYTCLSTGMSQSYDKLWYDHVIDETRHVDNNDRGGFKEGQKGHRRFGSMGDYEMKSGYNFNYDGYEGNNSTPRQLKRYTSHRMFSCITGEV